MAKKTIRLYEGKAKIVYETDEPGLLLQEFKDSATAFDGKKKGEIIGKGIVNCQISELAFAELQAHGVKTHFVSAMPAANEMLIKKLEMLAVEVVVRNIAAGSLAKRLGYEEQTSLKQPVIEFYYKNDELGDPLINNDHAIELGIATRPQLQELRELGIKINGILIRFFARAGLKLADFKLEFGYADSELILGDEISPDTCRLWDADTLEKLDKDRFRRDLGGIEDAYQEVLRRLKGVTEPACGESK